MKIFMQFDFHNNIQSCKPVGVEFYWRHFARGHCTEQHKSFHPAGEPESSIGPPRADYQGLAVANLHQRP